MTEIKHKFVQLVKTLWGHIKGIIFGIVKFVLELAFTFIPLTTVAHWIKQKFPNVWDMIMNWNVVKTAISKTTFRRFGSITKPRPHPYTMAADYPTWFGFVDRTYTGRHLPPDIKADKKQRPDTAKVVELFLRGEKDGDTGQQITDIRSSLLFASFAQWFTDSFLRTSHSFVFDSHGVVERDENNAPKRQPGRETKNDSNHEIDLCQIYGLSEEQTRKLRLNSETDRGCLKFQTSDDGEYPEFLLSKPPTDGKKELPIKSAFKDLHSDERVLRSILLKAERNDKGYETIFATGIEHGNATIGNSLFNVIFLREHNRIAREIAKANPEWNDEKVFQLTRNTMIVLILKIVISDYIRHISPLDLPLEYQKGLAEQEPWNRSNRIHIEFNILYRWHGLVPDEFSFFPDPKNVAAFRHNNKWLMETGIAKAVGLFSNEPAGRMIIGNTPRFLAGVKQDTVTIMRAAKLASYNAYRERFSLPAAKVFEDINDDPQIAQKLKEMYQSDIDSVEWYVGMCAEKHGQGMIMGDLMLNMVAHDAFTHALTNPLLSEQVFQEDTFSQTGWDIIHSTSTLKQIVERVTQTGDVCCEFNFNKAR